MDPTEIVKALAAPFDPKDVKWKPQAVKGERALAVAYVTARGVMERLDAVLGPQNWQDDYEPLPDGNVLCRLKVRFDPSTQEWITKADVGGPSEQPDSGDRGKSAVSDSLKRAAVKLGVGRYLYRLPSQWCDYDPVKRLFRQTPGLPAWAMPGGSRPAAPQTAVTQAQPAAGPKATAEQLDRLLTLATAKKITPAAFAERLKLKFKVDRPSDLTVSQADVIIKLFESQPMKAA